MSIIDINILEKELIYLLNCINFTIQHFKEDDDTYFKKSNYKDYLYDLTLIHRKLSLLGNRYFYNKKDDVFFIGQKDYLISKEKNFQVLKYNKQNKSKQIDKTFKKNKFNYFKSKFYFFNKEK